MFLFNNSSRLRQSLSASVLILFLCSSQKIFSGQAELQPLPSVSMAENFTLPDLTAKPHALTDYRGKVVLINFWASWCPPCIYEMPKLAKLKQRFANQPFEILTLNVGEKKYKVRKFAKLIKLELPILLDTDSDTFNDWGVKILPTSFLLDGSGIARYRVQGDPGWNDEHTFSTIEKLITETTSSAKETQNTAQNTNLKRDMP